MKIRCFHFHFYAHVEVKDDLENQDKDLQITTKKKMI